MAKLVPERIFSLEVHPSDQKLLVLAGDKWGKVGLWDVDVAADDSPVTTFNPHTRPVQGLRVAPHAPQKLYSCSHDGSVHCLDLAGGATSSFAEVYLAPEDEDGDRPTLHGISRTAGEGGALAVSRGDGAIVFLDSRTPSGTAMGTAALHEKKCFCADYSPTAPWLLATASLDRTVALWDVRKFGGAKAPKPLAVLDHGLSVTAVRFSGSGARLLTTCNDNLLRVFEGNDAKWMVHTAVTHDNKTGMYLTPFQAEWVRGSDSAFLCGSMAHPRGVDVFSLEGDADSYRLDEEENVTSVVSLFAQHPTKPVLVGGNASGKVYVWR